MSLISSFIANNLLASLESEFAAHEPELQAQLLAEVQLFLGKINDWVSSKVSVPVISAVDPAQ